MSILPLWWLGGLLACFMCGSIVVRESDIMHNKKLSFSLLSSALIIVFLALFNTITTPNTLWCIYPIYAVLWWPLSIFCVERKRYLLLAVLGSACTALLLVLVNVFVAPGFPWSIYPTLVLLWWPLGVYCAGRKKLLLFSILGTIILMAILISLNSFTASPYPWSVYPILTLLWWPLTIYCASTKRYKLLSIVGSALIISTLIFINYYPTGSYPWFLYAAFPILWWPMFMLLGQRAKTVSFAVISSIAIIAFYMGLNFILSPGYLWFYYPAFAILWWPMAVYFAKKKQSLAFSIAGTLLSSGFFILVNHMTTPEIIWWVYPIFAMLWWPLSLSFFGTHTKKASARS